MASTADGSGHVTEADLDQDLSKRTWSGLQWTYGASLIGALLQVGYTAAMGRLLSPSDFGVLAMAAVCLRFGQYFAEMGVGPALVQAPSMSASKVRTAFALNLTLSVAVAAAFVPLAGLARFLLDDPVVVPVVQVMASGMVLGALGMTAQSLLRRELRFQRLAVNQLISFVCGYLLVGLVLAALGAGVWSLVAAHLTQTLVRSLLDLSARPHPVRGGWSGADALSLFQFGGRVSAISFAEFLGVSLDTLIIGRVAGGDRLGQYNRAFLLVNLPLEHLLQGVQQVLFPAFSRIQEQRERLSRTYWMAFGVAAALLVPTATGIAWAAEPLTLVLLGGQWGMAAQVVPFLAAGAVVSLLALLGAVICEATADLNRKLALQSFHVIVLVGLLLAAGTDLRRLAAAVALAQLVRGIGYFGLMRRILGTTLRQHLTALLPALATGALVSVAGWTWNHLLADQVRPSALLSAHIASGAVILLLSLRIGPLSRVRADFMVWLDRADAFQRIPAWLRRLGGLSVQR
jgi:lipopolysaccharide exporter